MEAGVQQHDVNTSRKRRRRDADMRSGGGGGAQLWFVLYVSVLQQD